MFIPKKRLAILISLLFFAWQPPTVLALADSSDEPTLEQILSARSTEDRARDQYRNPAATLKFLRVEPSMTVAEGLPGGGWYSKILANYLGPNGKLYGVDYASRHWAEFDWSSPEWIAKRQKRAADFDQQVASYTNNGIHARGFTFETVPANINGTVDRVLLIRALHNLNRFEKSAQTRSIALTNIAQMLKPNGMVGVVQHRAPERASDAWADGSKGYLKQSSVIAMFEKAGFELVASSEINANPKDQPTTDDIVWRLPPSYRGSEPGSKRHAAMTAIGESDRMTLLFRKAP